MGGAYWAGNFDPSASQDAVITDEENGIYSVSLQKLAASPIDVMHFMWDGMYPHITIPSDCRGMVASTDMRLAPDDGYTTADETEFMGSIDADSFATLQTTIGPQGWNDGLPQARMKWVTADWRRFYDTTLSVAALQAKPPYDV